MLNVITCILYEHNLWMVILASFILVMGCAAFTTLLNRFKTLDGRLRWEMIFFSASIITVTVWATHFVAMAGYQLSDQPKQYAFGLTLISALLIMPIATLAIAASQHYSFIWVKFLSGSALGLGVAAMHYSGVNALNIPFGINWDYSVIAASIAIGSFFGALSFYFLFSYSETVGKRFKHKVYGTLCLILAVAGLHFTAMSGMSVYAVQLDTLSNGIDEILLAISIVGLSIVVSAMAFSMSLGDEPRKLWRRYVIALALFLSTGIAVFTVGSSVEANRLYLSDLSRALSNLQSSKAELLIEQDRWKGMSRSAQYLILQFKTDYAELNSLATNPSKGFNFVSSHKDLSLTYNQAQTASLTLAENLAVFASKLATVKNTQELSQNLSGYDLSTLGRQLDGYSYAVSQALIKAKSQTQITWFFMGSSSLLVFIFQGIAIFWPAHSSITRTLDEVEARKETAERLALVAEHTSDAVLILSPEKHEITWCNRAATNMFDLCEDELVGSFFRDHFAVDSEVAERAMGWTTNRLRRGENIHFEQRLAAEGENNKDKWVSISMSPLFDFDGKLQQVIIAARDISVRRDLEKELRGHRDDLARQVKERTETVMSQSLKLEQALASERELNELQTEFVSMASHEFRTPLTIIDGLARRLEKRADRFTPDEIREKAGSIRASIVRMTMLIERTLDASRLSSGRIKLAPSFFDARELVKDVCKRQSDLSPRHEIEIDVENYPATLFGDGRLLDNVFTNLLSNAVKYSSDRPKVFVNGWTEGHDAILTVRDSGVGISKDELPKIFQRFFRAKTSTGIPGTGIGLNLVKNLVEMHWGKVSIESEEGAWTEIRVTLPLESPLVSDEELDQHETSIKQNVQAELKSGSA